MRRSPFVLALSGALTLGCGPAPRLVAPLDYVAQQSAPAEPFRAQAPPLAPVVDTKEVPRETRFPSGLRVVLVERHDFPVVAAQLLLDRGALDIDEATPDAIGQMTYLFGRGGEATVAHALSVQSGETGVTWWTSSGDDGTEAGARGPSEAFDVVVSALARECVAPQLSEVEFAQRTAEIRQSRTFNQLFVAERAVLFGSGHPYGRWDANRTFITRDEAQSLHDRIFQPAHATLVIVGDVTPAQVDESTLHWLASWKTTVPIEKKGTPPPVLDGPRVTVTNPRGLAQTHVAVFARGPLPGSENADALELAAELLGGAVSSALWTRVREGTGASYEISAHFYRRRAATWLSLEASYDRGKAVAGVQSVVAAIEALRSGNVTHEEIVFAREKLLSRWRHERSTVDGAASLFATWAARGADLAGVSDYPARIARLGSDDVVRVARAYLSLASLRIVFMGEMDPSPLGMGAARRLVL